MSGGGWSVGAMRARMPDICGLGEDPGSAVARSLPGWSVECGGCGKAGVDGVKMPSGWVIGAAVATEGLAGVVGLL
jgi:hypothetical protein